MGPPKTRSWVTSALNNDSVEAALVLAESIRRTKTNFMLTVITSQNVSRENRAALRQGFDMVLMLEEIYDSEDSANLDEVLSKVYAFSLAIFEKCVFVSTKCLFLENADKLFAGMKYNLESRVVDSNGLLDLSLYSFVPNKQIYELVLKATTSNGNKLSDDYLAILLKNQKVILKTGRLPDGIISDFSMDQGKLLSEKTHTPVIQFINGKCGSTITRMEMKQLGTMSLGLHEKNIVQKWLEISKMIQPGLCKSIHDAEKIENKEPANEPIAIVGMSCRYPGANTLKEFWNLLYAGEEGISEPPAFRWTKEHSVRVTQQDRKSQAGFLSVPVDEFDAKFFGVSPKEAAYMDPQTRLLHEVVWESLEDAGIDPLSLYGTHAGIFTGSWMNDYKDIVASSAEKDFFRTYMGNSIGAAAARLSFLLGLTGPSIATESGCSSAIVALDLAVKSLRNGETNLALAGGVNLLLHAFNSSIMEFVISPGGRCKTFDANADGFGRAEGCGVLVLKRMSDALKDGDRIWALIRGSAVSQEGLSRSLGTPTVHCEALAMKLALENAGVSPEQVSFVETHGTGTAVGDPMEVAAISKAYYSPNRQKPLIIGSVKTNVGHTESCSGITGIMKAVLAMQNELIPKHLNLETLNPEIFLDSIPAMIPLEPVPWPKVKGQPRICGVSSFGITGTDGHVIIQEAPDCNMSKFTLEMERPMHILKISGKSMEALEELKLLYANQFSDITSDQESEPWFANAAYSANVGRSNFSYRAFLVARDQCDAVKILNNNTCFQGEVKGMQNPPICFLFTGQGSQYPGMAKMLYETSPVFRIHFDACDRILRERYNLSLKQVMWESEPSSKHLSRTIFSQTSIFCVEYCLFKLWQSWGMKPDYVLGHSLGEFSAAVAAQILSFEDALMLVAERSSFINRLPTGSMLVIKANKPEVQKLLASANIDLDFAAVNSPEQTVVAGDTEKVSQFLAYLKQQNIKAIVLDATHAFHSRHMDPMLENYRKIASGIKYKPGTTDTQYVSGVEGQIIYDSSELNANYWVRHTREKVNFVDACKAIQECGVTTFLEIGPQPILSSFILMNCDDSTTTINCLPSLRKGTNDWETILTSLGKLYLLGYEIDWKGFDEPYARHKVSLPFHPFHRKSFWVESSGQNATMIHPLVGTPFNNATTLNIFQHDLVLSSVPYLKDHCIGNRVIFPGAGFTEMCLAAGYCVANNLNEQFEQPTRALQLENMRIEAPLEIKPGKRCRFQVAVNLAEQNDTENLSGFQVKVYHQNSSDGQEAGKWILHASSTFVPVGSTKSCLAHWNPNRIPEIMETSQPQSAENFYKICDQLGLKFGTSFRSIQRYWIVPHLEGNQTRDEIVAEIPLPDDWNKYVLHPLVVDAMFQAGIVNRMDAADAKLQVPVTLGQITRFPAITSDEPPPKMLYVHVSWSEGKTRMFVSTPSWSPLAYLEDLELVETSTRTIDSVLEQQSSIIPDAWEETWKPISSPLDAGLNRMVDIASIVNPIPLPIATEETATLYAQTKTLLRLYILQALYQLGWQPAIGEHISDINTFCTKFHIQPSFSKLIYFYFTELQHLDGFLILNIPLKCWIVKRLPPDEHTIHVKINELVRLLSSDEVAGVTRIYERISRQLAQVLKGEESALALLFPSEPELQGFTAESYYRIHPCRKETEDVVIAILSPLIRKTFELNSKSSGGAYRVLEVGAGTGSMSQTMMSILPEQVDGSFEYYYTDVSHSFFIKAEKMFEKYGARVKYTVFNIEQSPLSQGIPVEYFDLVVATDVLHATKDLEETAIHLRQTLRPGGVLCFTETIIPATDITFVFGLLDGYWRFTDMQWRQNHCCISETRWSQLLSKCGFRNVHCKPTYMGQVGCILAVANENITLNQIDLPKQVVCENEMIKKWIIFGNQQDSVMLDSLANMLVLSGYGVTVLLREAKNQVESKNTRLLKDNINIIVIKVEEDDELIVEKVMKEKLVQGLIYGWGMNKAETDQKQIARPLLDIAKTLTGLAKPPQLYVITQGIHPVNENHSISNPSAATLYGMVKSLKNESADCFIRVVDLEVDSSPERQVAQVLYEMAMCRGTQEHYRVQTAYRGNVRHEPKLGKALIHNVVQDDLKLPPSTERYHLKLPESRLFQDLKYEPLEAEHVQTDQVEVKVKAYALNFKDVLTILKPSKEFEQLNQVGIDFAGVVINAGVESKWKVGDRVFGANFKEDQLPSHLVVEDKAVLGIPNRMTFWEATTLPAVFLTAYHCLINVGKMSKGDTVLIHTGSGGVGLAAIQLAKHVGAKIITTAGNPRKRAYLRSLGIEHVFHSRDTSYEQDILRVTNGKGVNLVLNSITGPGIKEATLRATATQGRWVEMSKLSVWTPEEVYAKRPDVNYQIIDLTVLDKETCTGLMDRMQELLDTDNLKPLPFVKFDALALPRAMQYLQKAKHIGKVVVTMPEVKMSQGQFQTVVPLFGSESTYLITGGLGGIGFEVCKWMLTRGATDVVLTGRNEPNAEMRSQLKSFSKQGFNVQIILGDVGNRNECQNIIEEIKTREKPLRGIMHCAGVLNDNLYSNQNWPAFEATFNAKVSGTWNLHELTLNCPLEHFVVYSSITALIGPPGQPNHSAANCFQDAFIHYRHALGLPGTSINWGQWAQVGCAKDISMSGILPVSFKRMLNGMEVALRSQKKQVCFSDFDSFASLQVLCPLLKGSLDERLWRQATGGSSSGPVVKGQEFWKDMDAAEGIDAKTKVFSGYLKAIIRAALRLEPDEQISDTANLQELGVDSLMMIELKNSVQSLVGSSVSINAGLLKNCNTVWLLSEAVVGKLIEGETEDELPLDPLPDKELYDLISKDIILPEDIQISSEMVPAVIAENIESILITGATGHLGSHLLHQLITRWPQIKTVYCLLLGDLEAARNRLKQTLDSIQETTLHAWEKVHIVSGNITKPNLGISKDVYCELSGKVDAVIHCAAKMNPMEHLREISGSDNKTDCRSVNLGGTLNILRFACAGKVKHVYFPSSLTTALLSAKSESRLSEEWPDTNEVDSYVTGKMPGMQTCKFLGERLMEQAVARGIPCKVFRFPWIAGHSETGRVRLDNIYILRFLSYLRAGAMPSLVIPANFLPVDICSEISLKLFLSRGTQHEVYNICHPQPQVEPEFARIAEEVFGNAVAVLEQHEFQGKLTNLTKDGTTEELKDYHKISHYISSGTPIVAGYIASPETFFTNQKVSHLIPDYARDFVPPMEVLRKDLLYLKHTGLLAKFGI